MVPKKSQNIAQNNLQHQIFLEKGKKKKKRKQVKKKKEKKKEQKTMEERL